MRRRRRKVTPKTADASHQRARVVIAKSERLRAEVSRTLQEVRWAIHRAHERLRQTDVVFARTAHTLQRYRAWDDSRW